MGDLRDRWLREADVFKHRVSQEEYDAKVRKIRGDLDSKVEATQAEIARNAEEIEQAARDLKASVTELSSVRGEPVATVELTEAELVAILSAHTGLPAYRSAHAKLDQALAIERGSGGRFWDGGGDAA